jgi:hypothetical protein
MLCLIGSDKPIIESLSPNDVDLTDALENQFQGMTDIPFSYSDYKLAKQHLLNLLHKNLTREDKEFFLSVEMGTPNWSKCCAGDISIYPSVQWKLLNISKLKETNPSKFSQGIEKLKEFLAL